MFSDRIHRIKPSATLEMTSKAAELKRVNKPVYNLSVGEPDFSTPNHIQKAAIWAINNGVSTKVFLPNFKRYGRGAFRMRNIEIVNNADLVLAFWDGLSPGTKMTIGLAKKAKVRVKIFYL